MINVLEVPERETIKGLKMFRPAKLNNEDIHPFTKERNSRTEELEQVDQIFSWLKKPGARVLDLGCGSGLRARGFAGRGCKVTGVDLSGPAVSKARENTKDIEGVRFEAADIAKDTFINLGIHDLAVALEDTVSRLDRQSVLPLFEKIRRALAPGGVFVFSALYWGVPFQRNVVERGADGEVEVIWERELKEDRGTVRLKGHFLKDGDARNLEVQCYKAPELVNLLVLAGFSGVRWSNRLDFHGRSLKGADAIFYRASNAR